MKPATRAAAAAALSVALHTGAIGALLAAREENAEIAGGATAVSLVGDSLVDAISAGADMPTFEPVEPAAAEMDAMQPVEAAPIETALLQPVEPLTSPQTAPTPEAVELAPVQPSVEPAPSTESAPRTEPEQVEPVSPVQAVEAASHAEIQASETVAALETVPLPSARPAQPVEAQPVRQAAIDPTPRTERVQPLKPTAAEPEPKKPAREQARKKPAPRQAGNGGSNQADSRRGTASGRNEGEQAEPGDRRGNAAREGNAAASNYPGKVVAKLRRSLRYPAEARRQRVRGEVHVSFTVAAGGGVSGVRITRSSGSPVLDKAAIETVRRAAPFPPIPSGAGRSSWPFTVPLAFTR